MPGKFFASHINNISLIILCAWFAMLVTALPMLALDPGKQVTQYSLTQWTDENGLPQNSVFAICQTSDGYLWLGTAEGLARFDGIAFTVFDNTNTPAISKPYIRCLLEDSQKSLWIGTVGGGLLLYKNNTFKPFTEKDGLSSLIVCALQEDKAGNIWIGTEDRGICRLDRKSGRITVFTVNEGLPANGIENLYCDHAGDLWIGTSKGVSRFKDDLFSNYTLGTAGEAANVIYEDSGQNLWIGGTMGSLYRLQGNRFVKQTMGRESGKFEVNCIFEDSDRNLWLGSRYNGLLRFRDGQLSVLGNHNGLADNWILSVQEDREGNLWVGTSSSGLYRLKDDKFTAISSREGLADDIVFSVFEDSHGYVWIGTNNGLSRYRDGIITSFTTRDGLSHNTVDTITEDRQGNIWVGTDKGLNQLRNFPEKIVKLKDYLKDQYVPTIMQDHTGQIWAGTMEGAYKISDDQAQKFSQAEGLITGFVNLIYEDRQENLWFALHRRGIARYRDGKVTSYTTRNGLAANSLNCMYEDESGVLWWGSNSGLSRFVDGTFRNFSKADGLFNDNIYQILEDAGGNLWMSSNKGIFRVRKADLNALAAEKSERVKSVVYDKQDGMRSSECNGGPQGAGCKTMDGRLWFPTMKGVVWIDPQRMKTNRVKPPVRIEQVLLDGSAAKLDETVVIRPGTKRLELHVTALSFVDSENVKFKYRLQGYDEDWFDAGTRRSAGYTNLDGGTYFFRAIAANPDGLWNLDGASVTITVIPPFWKTPWFVLLVMLLFAFLSYVVIHGLRKYLAMASFWKKQKFVGPFKLKEKIGSGGMGTIYKANNVAGKRATDKKKTVAIKVLREDLCADENYRKRFRQEAAIIDQFTHPHIIRIFERGAAGRNLFIAMELLEGKTLAEKIRETQEIDLSESLHIMVQVAETLAEIHSKDIIHRDLKPDNIMLINKDGDANFVKLLDFGLARMQHQTRLTQTGIVIGTVSYMSPEQIAGKASTAASDIYALGIIFYEMITGTKPFLGETSIDIMKQILDKIPIEPIRFRKDISLDLNRLIMWILDKEAENRPSINEVLKQLNVTYAELRSPGPFPAP